jgi:cytochrome c-type biogenesis protein CcmH/NrfG
MKREYRILLVFISIVIVSGVIIMLSVSPKDFPPPQVNQGMGVFNEEEQPAMPAGPDTTKIRQTIVSLEDHLKHSPDDLNALADLGNAYYDIGDPPMAIQYYERALMLKPDAPGVIVDLGAMYRQNGEPDKAIAMFRKAIELDPRLPQAYFNLGMVLRLEKNDSKGAAEAWKKYLELDPNSQAKEFLQGEIAKAETE